MKKLFLVLTAFMLALTLATPASAAPNRTVNASVKHVSGFQYGEDIEIAWKFDGKPGQYPRLHIDVLCWYNEADVDNFSAKIAYGNSVYLDGYSVETQYPGEGTAYFWTGEQGGIAPWTNEPGPVYYCRANLLDWTTQGLRNQYPRFHATTTFTLTDSRG